MDDNKDANENEDSYTRESVKESISEIACNMFAIGETDKQNFEELELKEDVLCDALDIMELVMNLEDEFGIMISEEESEKIETFGDCIDIVCRKLGVK